MPAKRARSNKAWSGRMAEATHPLVEAFTTSYPIDCRLYPYDIAGSIAHARMLARRRIIPARDASRIVGGLGRIRREFERGAFKPRPQDEDVHMAIERRLIELLGPVGGKLHTARSRNDQIALDLRLFVRDAGSAIRRHIGELRRALGRQARRHAGAVMPGFTHLQPAQPVLFAHHLLAYVEMLERDDARLADCLRRANVLPLGAGALAGTTFPIDRAFVARALGFAAVSENSLDAVSDRDFVAELLAALAILGMHLSRFADEIVLWSSQQFGFIELPDAFATGSSMMPQKKNPDVGELVRGKTGRLYGNLVNLLTMLKGLPLAYNRDLQEDKTPLFDSVDTVTASLEVLSAMVPRLRVRTDRLRAAASAGYTLATELADYLAGKGVPFRDAHGVVGAIVQSAIAEGRQLEDLSLAELRTFSPAFSRDVKRWLTLDAAVKRRKATGGTSPANVERRLKTLGV
ncbi:MAG TPA: argininosuccinate lyase [Candidatus Dormibacteraeota bacterium]|nr:argininosuccinate lyase [Candidatus Dormibacteraeota bacterium]